MILFLYKSTINFYKQRVFYIGLVPYRDTHLFYARSHLRTPQKWANHFQPIFQLFLKLNTPVHHLLFYFCTVIFFYIKCIYSCVSKCVPVLCLVFCLYLSKKSILHFYILNEITNIKGICM